ncbi:MAG: hypothetical protein MJZ23_04390 [Paludibacteraceae bacterium]|nr:hypothetical protein [Paludibacteraceae bacterium]
MKKTFLLGGLLAIAAINFYSCNDDKDDNGAKQMTARFVETSECLDSYENQVKDAMAPYVSIDFDKGIHKALLTVNNFVSSCGHKPEMDIRVDGDTIIFRAFNRGGFETNCVCRYMLWSALENVEPKVYYIRPENMVDPNDKQVVDLANNRTVNLYFSLISR